MRLAIRTNEGWITEDYCKKCSTHSNLKIKKYERELIEPIDDVEDYEYQCESCNVPLTDKNY